MWISLEDERGSVNSAGQVFVLCPSVLRVQRAGLLLLVSCVYRGSPAPVCLGLHIGSARTLWNRPLLLQTCLLFTMIVSCTKIPNVIFVCTLSRLLVKCGRVVSITAKIADKCLIPSALVAWFWILGPCREENPSMMIALVPKAVVQIS